MTVFLAEPFPHLVSRVLLQEGLGMCEPGAIIDEMGRLEPPYPLDAPPRIILGLVIDGLPGLFLSIIRALCDEEFFTGTD